MKECTCDDGEFSVPVDHVPEIDYKYNEDVNLEEFKDYIASTYSQHYGSKKIQVMESIMSQGHGTGFCIGSIEKYVGRYGKKGTRDDARKDMVKVLHYALLMLYIHDEDL
jgi:hypothetical protein